MNLIQYYTTQAGSGIAFQGLTRFQRGHGYRGVLRHQRGHGFKGVIRYQNGHGFFGNIISKYLPSLLKFLGKQALNTGANIASDVLINKKNWKDSAKERLTETGKDILDTGVQKAKKFVLEGRGRKRKKSIKRKIVIKKGRFESFLNQ